MPVEAEAWEYCTKHLYKAENVGLGYNIDDEEWEDIILKSNIKVEFEHYEFHDEIEDI